MDKSKDQQAPRTSQRINPIDPDKVAENPHLLPYAHNVGSAVIKPIDKGRVKGLALEAMYDQTNSQLDQIREQVELLARQAQAIHDRVSVSEKIYQAEINFKPLMGKIYHLYQQEEKYILSMIAPSEWGKTIPYEFVATVQLLADHTWEVLQGEF